MRLKKAWMLATIMTLCGTMMTMSSCKKDDDPSVVPIPELTPEEQLKADTYERIKFLREDPALQELGIGRMFLFQEDDTYECATFYQADTNGDGKMDEDADTDQTRVDLLREVLDKYKDILVDPSKYGPELRLNDCRGKIILMQRFKESGKGYTNASFGIYCGGDDRNQVYENRYGDITWKVMEQDVCECVINPLHPKDDMDKFMKDRKELFEANLLDCNTEHADRPDTWHINKTSGYLKALGGLGMSYAVSANTMNQFANNTIRGRMGQKTGWIVMDFAGLDIEGSMRVNVYGDVLIQALIDNNRAMVNKGVLK